MSTVFYWAPLIGPVHSTQMVATSAGFQLGSLTSGMLTTLSYNGTWSTTPVLSGAQKPVAGIAAANGSIFWADGNGLVFNTSNPANITSSTYSQPARTSGPPLVAGAWSNALSAVVTMDASGHVYTSAGQVNGLTSISGAGIWYLAGTGPFFSALNGTQHLGVIALSSLTSGSAVTVAYPTGMSTVTTISVASGLAYIGGYTTGVLSSGGQSVAINPVDIDLMASITSGRLTVWSSASTTGVWTESSNLSGLGFSASATVTWLSNGLELFITDPINGAITVIDYIAGSLSTVQSIVGPVGSTVITLSGALNGLAITLSGAKQLIGTATSGATTWVTGGLALTGVGAGYGLSVYNSQIGNYPSSAFVALGYNSGVAWGYYASGVWTQIASTVLGWNVNTLTFDLSGNVWAVGSGAVAYIAGTSGVLASGTYSSGNSPNSCFLYRDQLVVSDPAASAISCFALSGQNLSQVVKVSSLTSPARSVVFSPADDVVYAGTSGSIYQFKFVAPYKMAAVRSGVVTVYNPATSGYVAGVSALTIANSPCWIGIDTSGNVQCATEQGNLLQLNASGTVVSTDNVWTQGGGVAGIISAFSTTWAIIPMAGSVLSTNIPVAPTPPPPPVTGAVYTKYTTRNEWLLKRNRTAKVPVEWIGSATSHSVQFHTPIEWNGLPGVPTALVWTGATASTLSVSLAPPSGGGTLDYGSYTIQYATGASYSNGPTITYCTMSGSVTDSFSNVWTITSGGLLDCNSINVEYSSGVSLVMLNAGTLWQYEQGSWYSYAPTGYIGNAATLGHVFVGPLSTTPLNSVTITGLTSVTNYNLRAYVSNSIGSGTPSSAITASTTISG